ncbi:hypothetical protein V5799_016944 [Amblyomma americanum]|uniref:Adenylate cyclase n=1 Tax=Amblyomma americanum TaxID=6943 RepID=A0AAQ4F3K2_AMBAM
MADEVRTEPPHTVPHHGSDSPNDSAEPNAVPYILQESKRSSDVSVVSCVSTWRRAVQTVLMARLEIFLVFYLVARRMSSTALQDLLIHKSCLNDLALNASVCSHLDDFEEFKDMAEKAASMTSMMRAVVLLTPSAVIAIFVGPWCDKYGYRTPLVTATFGFLASTLLDVFTVYHMGMALYVNILTAIPDGLCGGPICVLTAVCSEATLTTKEKRRRIRFFAISVTISLSSPLGSYVGGLLYGRFGWETVLYSSFAIAALGMVWSFVAIKNLMKPDHAKDGLSLRFRNFFQLQNLTESVRNAMKPRPNSGRLQLWCLFGAICCVMFDLALRMLGLFAAMGIAYFYVRKMYSWSVSHYSTVQSVSAVVGVALNTPIIYLFVKVFKISDPAMAVVGVSFATAQMIILGLAYEEWLYYLRA